LLFRGLFDEDRLVRCLGLRGLLVLGGAQFAATGRDGKESRDRMRVRPVSSVAHNSTLVRFRVLYQWLRLLS
jgi:hypothetical protein